MKPLALLLVLLVALPMLLAIRDLPPAGTPDAPIHTHVGARYVEGSLAETGMRNVVTAVLLNYRGFDTFLEVVVIFTALAAVLALPRPGPAGTVLVVAETSPRGAVRRPTWREAIPVSPLVSFVVRLLAPFIAVFAVAVLYQGHVSPGGGFQGAAVLGALFIALSLTLGPERAKRLIPRGARAWLQGAAPLVFALVAFVGWRLSGAVLGFPTESGTEALRDALVFALEIGIVVGGAVVLARLFIAMEA